MENLQYILKPKNWSSGSKMFLVYTLMKVDNRVSFISIAFAVVKLKISKFCLAIQHPWNGSSRELFGSLLPQIWSNFVKILIRGSTLANRNIVWKFFEGFKKKWQTQSLTFWSYFDTPLPLKMAEIENNRLWRGKPSAIELSKYVKTNAVYLLSPFREKYDYFLHYSIYFCQETQQGHKLKG